MASTNPSVSINDRLIRIAVHGRLLECDPSRAYYKIDDRVMADQAFATTVKLLGLGDLFLAVILLDMSMYKFRETTGATPQQAAQRAADAINSRRTSEEYVRDLMEKFK